MSPKPKHQLRLLDSLVSKALEPSTPKMEMSQKLDLRLRKFKLKNKQVIDEGSKINSPKLKNLKLNFKWRASLTKPTSEGQPISIDEQK